MRERYIKMRQEGVIDISLMYEYFMKKKKKKILLPSNQPEGGFI